MGLLNRVSESDIAKEEKPVALDKPLVKKSNSVGLLKKSLGMAGNENRLDFFEFIHKYKLSLCAVFNSQNNEYCVEHSTGLDAKSICLSVSTADFWNGIQDKQDDNSLPFYQFFSDKLKDNIKNVKCYKTPNGKILLYRCDSKPAEDFYKTADSLGFEVKHSDLSKPSANSLFYKIDFSEAIDSFVIANAKPEQKDRLINAISYELYINLLKNFPEPAKVICIKPGLFKAAVPLESDQQLPIEVISNHIRLENQFVLEKDSELINVESCDNFEAE